MTETTSGCSLNDSKTYEKNMGDDILARKGGLSSPILVW